MAEVITKISLKKSSVPGAIPPPELIDAGELVVNYADGKLYYKDDVGAIQLIGTKNPENVVDSTAKADDAVQRVNHTGTQAQSTVTNLVSDLAAKATQADIEAYAAKFTDLDYAPLNADQPGVVITGTLTSDGSTSIVLPSFLLQNGADYYWDEASGIEVYSGGTPNVDPWYIYDNSSGVSWTSGSNETLDMAVFTPDGANTGTPLATLSTRPKTTGQFARYDSRMYENLGDDTTPAWQIIPLAGEIKDLAAMRVNDVAYVSPDYGNNATASIGAINRPFASVSAAIAASAKICILDDASWAGGTPLAVHLEIHLREGATLTQTGTLTVSTGKKVSVTGDGNIFFNPATNIVWRDGTGNFSVDVAGDITINSLVDNAIIAGDDKPSYINCRRFFAQRNTIGSNGLFTAFNGTATKLYFGENIRFHSQGVCLFAVGGSGSDPKIHFGANCLVWTNGTSVFGSGGSAGGAYMTGFVANATASVTTGVSLSGTATFSAPWLTEAHFTQL